jgi:hypothetical protein
MRPALRQGNLAHEARSNVECVVVKCAHIHMYLRTCCCYSYVGALILFF